MLRLVGEISADRISGGMFFLVGLGALIGAVRLQIGSPGEPQPGFFPFLAALGMLVLSVTLIVQDWRGRSSGTEPFSNTRPPLYTLLGLVAFVVIIGPLGYMPAIAVLTIVLLLVLGVRERWKFALLVPLVSIGSFILFDKLLNVPLPAGPLARWLGV